MKKTKDEIVNERISEEMEKNSAELRANFKKCFDRLMERIKKEGDKLTFEEACFFLYNQGHLDSTSQGVEITPEEWETECFLKFVKDCVVNPHNKEAYKLEGNDYVRISYPCTGHLDCQNWPDRCEDVGGDGYTCSRLVNINKLCGVEAEKVKNKAEGKFLTRDEIDQLADILAIHQ